MSFKDYRSNRKDAIERLKDQANKLTQGSKFEKDPDDWYPIRSKDGNNLSVIRFLPSIEGEDCDFVSWFSHSFKNEATGRWYIENCRSTFGFDNPEGADPCMEYNNKLWNSAGGKNAPKTHPNIIQASAQKRNQNFRANILVISDSHNPENNGKMKKYRHTRDIFRKYIEAANPPVELGEHPIDPFDLYTGANLKIKITTDKNKKDLRGNPVANYELTWLPNAPLGDDVFIEKIYNELNSDPKWSLKQYVSKDKFKSYDDLLKRLTFVLGFNPIEEGVPTLKKVEARSQTVEPKQIKTVEKEDLPWENETSGDTQDDPDEFFKSLRE